MVTEKEKIYSKAEFNLFNTSKKFLKTKKKFYKMQIEKFWNITLKKNKYICVILSGNCKTEHGGVRQCLKAISYRMTHCKLKMFLWYMII